MLYFTNTQIHRRPFLNPVTESKVTLRDSFLRQVPTIPVACRLTNSQARNYLTSEGSVKPPNTNAGYFCLRVYFYFYTYLSLQICFFAFLAVPHLHSIKRKRRRRYCLTRVREPESRPKPGKQETTTKTTPVLHSRVCWTLP